MSLRSGAWSRLLCLAALTLPALPLHAEEASLPACPAYEASGDLLNPEGEPAERQAALESLIAASKAQGYARHQLGSLYRLGRAHPAGLLDRDLVKAKRLLSHAALDGYLMAMAGVAEIELGSGRPMDAMVWAQAYVHFKRKFEPVPEDYTEAYPADLLDRIYERLGRSSAIDAEIADYLSAFVATHGPKIEAARGRSSSGTPTCRSVSRDLPTERIADDEGRFRVLNTRASREIHSPGLVLFKLAITPEGQVANIMVMDSLPDAAAAEGLRESVKRMQFNPVAADAPLRVVLLPMSFDDRSVRLRD